MNWIRLAWAAALFALPQASHALIVDFTQAGQPGNLGSNTFTSGPVTVDAFYLSGKSYTNQADSKHRPVTLFVRNEDDDKGFGVCAPEDQSKSACAKPGKYHGGGGDTNELDNEGTKELLRLKLAPGWSWDKVLLSTISKDEKGELWFTDTPGLDKNLGSFASLLKAYKGTSSHFLEIGLSQGPAADATYLYFIPTGNDTGHMIWQVGVTQVPEPATVGLLAVGLGMLGAVRLRKAP